MGLDALAYLGWREAIIALVTLLTIYVVIVFLRINRLRRERSAQPATTLGRSAVAAYADAERPLFVPPYVGVEPVVGALAAERASPAQSPQFAQSAESAPKAPEPLAAPSEAAFPWNEPPEPVAPFAGQRQLDLLEREVGLLRKELGSLRAELQSWHAAQQAAVPAEPVAMPPPISPLYSEPMQMALHGASAGEISMHCGISRAEAELVVALVRNRAGT